jgi:hypothetical protein
MINTNNRAQSNLDTKAVIKRIYIKAVEDDSTTEYQVLSESSRGSRSPVAKFGRKEQAIDYARKLARQHNVRFSGEDA